MAWTVLPAMAAGFSIFQCGSSLAQETTLRLATFVNQSDIRYEALQFFADKVAENTDGRIVVEIHDSNTLHPFDKAIDSLRGEVSDISPLISASIDDRLPCTKRVHFMPMNVDWQKVNELDQELVQVFNEEFEKLGLKIVTMQNASYDQEWYFREPVSVDFKLDQLNGKIVRSVAPMITNVIENFGGKAVFISPTETYQSVERGVVDIANMSISTFSSWNMWEVMPNMLRTDMFYVNVLYTMRKDQFDSLSQEDQQAILDASKAQEEWLHPAYTAWVNEQLGDAMMQKGGSTVTLPPEERLRIIEVAQQGWNDKIPEACGEETARKIDAIFAKYAK
jgi:TRAP-type transport system periplasmic protein